MGCTMGKPENVKLTEQTPLDFALVPSLVKKESAVYVLKERVSLKSLFLGKDSFHIKNTSGEDVLKLKQSSVFDLGQDKMEIKDVKNDSTLAVYRRARMSFRATFYIYTVNKPYPQAEPSNESLDAQKLYCWGYLSTARGFNCVEDYEVGQYYFDPAETDPKAEHPYKPAYIFKCWKPCFDTQTTIGFVADENGGVKKASEDDPGVMIAKVERDCFQWEEANCYGLEVAAGVDAALCIAVASIIDEINEDQNDRNNN